MSAGRIWQIQVRTFRSLTLSRSSFVRSSKYRFFGFSHKFPHAYLNSTVANRITPLDTHFCQAFSSSRYEESPSAFDVNYEDVLKAQKDDTIVLIDVREQDEINETGKLPGSIHIPMGNVANNLTSLSDDDFKKNYGKDKPNKDTKIILSCRSGKRSAKVQAELQKMGYKYALNYTGGWLDWEEKQRC